MKKPEHYAKLVFGLRWKKVDKLMEKGEQGEKLLLVQAMAAFGKTSDEGYNHLVEHMQKATDKTVKIEAIKGLASTGRSAALTQLNFIVDHNEDAELVKVAQECIAGFKKA